MPELKIYPNKCRLECMFCEYYLFKNYDVVTNTVQCIIKDCKRGMKVNGS